MGSLARPPIVTKPVNVLVIGAGSRGNAYATGITHLALTTDSTVRIGAVAEPDPWKRKTFGQTFIWSSSGEPDYGQSFSGWEEWIIWELSRRKENSSPPEYVPVSAVMVCTLDPTHHPILTKLAPLGLHILCEKPLALSLSHCLDISNSLSQYPPKILSIGHVLRYSPHNIMLHRLVCEDLAIGEIISIEHTEPIGWWHFSHSYVRGNWRRETDEGVGSLLSKSCHDIDFLMWMMASPNKLTGGKVHEPSTIYSTGALTHFRKSRKPKAAGTATNCLQCPLQDSGCDFSAKRIYLDNHLRKGNTHWPVAIVAPDIEDILATSDQETADSHLLAKLADDYDTSRTDPATVASRSWYGRCVYESDNTVCDEQTVVINWTEDPLPSSSTTTTNPPHSSTPPFGRGPKTALFHMTYPTAAQCERRGRIYGTRGEIAYDSAAIELHTFADQTTQRFAPSADIALGEGHGGGDFGLAANFARAVAAAEDGTMSVGRAQRAFVGCDGAEVVRSHAVVFAGEESRRTGEVVRWGPWWEGMTMNEGRKKAGD